MKTVQQLNDATLNQFEPEFYIINKIFITSRISNVSQYWPQRIPKITLWKLNLNSLTTNLSKIYPKMKIRRG